MAELKTRQTLESVSNFLEAISDEKKKRDSLKILEMIKQATGLQPHMWGDSIVGFGSYRYKYQSGREGDWFLIGFSPRKQNLTLYIMAGFDDYDHLLKKLGKYKTGKACLYIKKLEDVDTTVLQELVTKSVRRLSQGSP